MARWSEFYVTPPQRAIALEELEEGALLRLCVLRMLANAPSAERYVRTTQDMSEGANDAFARLEVDCDLDHVTHYALRLAFCTDLDRLEWLVEAEARLMALRLQSCQQEQVVHILHVHGRSYQIYKAEDLNELMDARRSEWVHQMYPSASTYVRVKFQEATRLVGRRRLLLDRGYCWLPAQFLYLMVVNVFTSSLRSQLIALHRSLPTKRHEIERLRDVIDHIYAESMVLQQMQQPLSLSTAQDFTVTPHNVDDVADKHFPLCMRHLHHKLRENHHLKFDGRVQYRVFLKGLGFSVHDSILFFRNEFTRVIPPAKFDREYVYHIRHSYGLEGSRKDYAPMDCEKIISGGAPRHGQYHGCPFKHWDTRALENELQRMGVHRSQAEGIARTASQGEHQTACATLFEVLHRHRYHTEEGEGGVHMHPNQWVFASIHCNPSH